LASQRIESEAAPMGEEGVERKVQEALACPCVSHLKEGPCGPQFVEAFSCFIRSQESDADQVDCAADFGVLKECMLVHPAQFEDLANALAGERDDSVPSTTHGQGEAATAKAP